MDETTETRAVVRTPVLRLVAAAGLALVLSACGEQGSGTGGSSATPSAPATSSEATMEPTSETPTTESATTEPSSEAPSGGATTGTPEDPSSPPGEGQASQAVENRNDLEKLTPSQVESVEKVGDSTVRVTLWSGNPACHGVHVELDESGDTVTVKASQGVPPGAPDMCTQEARLVHVDVGTQEPVGDREIVPAKP